MIKVYDVTLRDTCRSTHGDQQAIEEALVQLRDQATEMLQAWPQGSGMTMRFELHYERPTAEQDQNGT